MKNFQNPRTGLLVIAAIAMICVIFAVAARLTDVPSTPVSQQDAVQNKVGGSMDENISLAKVRKNIVPHKALYRLSLSKIHSGSPVSEIGGRMYFKWEDVCDAWSTDNRFRVEYFYTDRPSVMVTNHFVSWESKEGDRLNFLSEGFTDGVMDENTRGDAHRLENGTGVADYSEPVGLSYRLPKGFYFPATHTIETIRQALAGNRFFNAVMFDGTDDEGPLEVNAFIDQSAHRINVAGLYQKNDNINTELLNDRYWDMRLAFFPTQGEDADMSTPSYEMKIRLHENGVVSDIVVEYDKFAVHQELVALSVLPKSEC